MGSTILGAVAGLIPLMIFGAKWRKKTVLGISSLFYMLGYSLIAGSQSYAMLIVGRTIAGVGHGITCQLVPALISDISPKKFRGFLASLGMISMNTGILFGFSISWGMSTASQNGWRITFGIMAGLTLIHFPLYLILVPDSPRDLIHNGDIYKAKGIMATMASDSEGAQISVDTESEIDEMIYAIKGEQDGKFRDLLSPGTFKAVIVACALQIAKQSTGFSVVQYFAGFIFDVIGPFKNNGRQIPLFFIGVTQVIAVVISTILIDKVGRKKLLLVSAIGMSIGMIAFGSSFIPITEFTQTTSDDCTSYSRCSVCLLDAKCAWAVGTGSCAPMPTASNATIGALGLSDNCSSVKATSSEIAGEWCAFVMVLFALGMYSLGFTGIPWLIQSEIFPQKLKNKAGSIASCANWLGSYIWNVSFLHLAFRSTLPGVFWIYSILSLVILLPAYWALPETKGKSLEEIVALFEGRKHEEIADEGSQKW